MAEGEVTLAPKPDPETGTTRHLTGGMKKLVTAVAITASIYHLLYVAGVFSMVGYYIAPGTHSGISFGFIIALTFMLFPATKRSPRSTVPWYDFAIIIAFLVPSLYYAVNYNALVERSLMANDFEVWLGVIVVLVVFEAARRTVGLILTIIGAIAFAYPFVSQFMPGLLNARAHTFNRIMSVMYFYPEGIFGSVYQTVSTVVVAFLIFGAIMQVSGAGKFFINLATAALGGFRGGPAKVAVLSSAMFASISGSAIANVASTGVITIPMMKKIGYKPYFAAAVEAVSSNGGPLTPPVMGAVAFIMADFLDITYFEVMTAAIIPAVLYYLAVFVAVHIEAVRGGLKGLPREQLPSARKVLKEGWLYFIPLVLLVYFLAYMRYDAGTACIYSIVAFIVVSWFKKDTRLGPRSIARALDEGISQGMPSVAAATAIANILMGALIVTGLNLNLGGAIVNLVQGNVALLLIGTAIFCLILGMAEATITVYLLGVILVLPALTLAGMPPLVSHFFIFMVARASMITPPICLVAYVAASIAGSNFMRTGFEAMRLGAVLLIMPFILAYSPELLLIGSGVNIVLATVTATLGVCAFSMGLQGYVLKRANWFDRVLLIAGGLLLIIPGWVTDVMGLAAIAIPVLRHVVISRLAVKPAAT